MVWGDCAERKPKTSAVCQWAMVISYKLFRNRLNAPLESVSLHSKMAHSIWTDSQDGPNHIGERAVHMRREAAGQLKCGSQGSPTSQFGALWH